MGDRRQERTLRGWVGFLLVGALPVLIAPAPPALARGGADRTTPSAADLALARAEETRRLLDGPRIDRAIAAAMAMEGIAARPVRLAPAVVPTQVPPPLREPVATLLGAVATAEDLARSAAARRPDADVARLHGVVEGALFGRVSVHADGHVVPALADLAREDVAAVREHRRSRAAQQQYAAALTLAAAVHRAVPSLQTTAGESAARGRGAACDLVDLPPTLCIGGIGANTYTDDYVLQIDLAGDDRYVNSAAVAAPDLRGASDTAGVGGRGNDLVVSLLVDVAGDDVYASPLPTRSGQLYAQGSGVNGGIGMLVDVVGDDRYEARETTVERNVDTNPFLGGQGAGYFGVGVLADLDGDDSYRLRTSRPGAGFVFGLGQGTYGGGVFLDASGDDDYLLEARPAAPAWQESFPGFTDKGPGLRVGPGSAYGFGQGAGGAGIFADLGGRDRVVGRAALPPVAPDETRRIESGCLVGAGSCYPYQQSQIFGGGMGLIGAALAVTAGTGDTVWSLSADASATRSWQANALGLGHGNAGLGALYDGGGSDRYELLALNHRRAEVAETCDGCPLEARAQTGWATRASTPGQLVDSPGGSFAGGMGTGNIFGGTGTLVDPAGDDVYTLHALTTARAAVAPSAVTARQVAFAESGLARVEGQGHAAMGVGVLADGAGDDLYDAVAVSDATANVPGSHAGDKRGEAHSWAAVVLAQAATSLAVLELSHAELRDAGGTDRFRSQSVTAADAEPATVVSPGGARSRVQGSVNGIVNSPELKIPPGYAFIGGGEAFLFSDGSPLTRDVFSASPANPACTGTRGQGVWSDCTDEVQQQFHAVGGGVANVAAPMARP